MARKIRPALTPEAREAQLSAIAYDVAEKQMLEGTASSQVITHFLKLASSKEKDRLERELLEKEVELKKAKTDALQSEKRREELFEKAIRAMKKYSGNGDDDEDSDF